MLQGRCLFAGLAVFQIFLGGGHGGSQRTHRQVAQKVRERRGTSGARAGQKALVGRETRIEKRKEIACRTEIVLLLAGSVAVVVVVVLGGQAPHKVAVVAGHVKSFHDEFGAVAVVGRTEAAVRRSEGGIGSSAAGAERRGRSADETGGPCGAVGRVAERRFRAEIRTAAFVLDHGGGSSASGDLLPARFVHRCRRRFGDDVRDARFALRIAWWIKKESF